MTRQGNYHALSCSPIADIPGEARVTDHRLGQVKGKSSSHIDRLRESRLHSSIFRVSEDQDDTVDFERLREVLKKDRQIPEHVAAKVLLHIQDNLDQLGLERPNPSLVIHWLTGLLRERGYPLSEGSLQSLELSMGDVELNIYHPVGLGAGARQNPEATSQKIAQRVKAQFAEKRVFQEEVIQAHDTGRLDLLHMGAIDRPHDIFLTPDYLTSAGLPVTLRIEGEEIQLPAGGTRLNTHDAHMMGDDVVQFP